MLLKIAQDAKLASIQLSQYSTVQKNNALHCIADLLTQQSATILAANEKDIQLAKQHAMSEAMIDRLLLTQERLNAIVHDVRQVCLLTDPVGEVIDGRVLNSGLKLQRHRVPLGVIGVIYEARPNVTIDIASLCLKTGNVAILRGGKETSQTNAAMIEVIQQALAQSGLPEKSIQSINNPDRKYINELLKLDKYIDMLIPRGGSGLHKLCREESSIPVITGGIGVCHMFVDESADFEKAMPLIVNAKTQRPSACNSLETLLVHRNIAEQFLPKLSPVMAEHGVTLHADSESLKQLKTDIVKTLPVEDEALRSEWLSNDLNVVVVDSLEKATSHILEYGTAHSDAILTRDLCNAEKFVNLVDSATVYVNASTRFTDGAQFGLGAEVAVSTQKLHARGPMGLEALTTYKWVGYGDDLIRS